MGDYARGLVSYTIRSHVADRLESWYGRAALSVLVYAHKDRRRQQHCGTAQKQEGRLSELRQAGVGETEEEAAEV